MSLFIVIMWQIPEVFHNPQVLISTHAHVRVGRESHISYFYTFDFCPGVKYQGQKMFPLNFALHIFTSQRFMEEGIKVRAKADENIERAARTARLWERRNWRRMNGGRVRKRRDEL